MLAAYTCCYIFMKSVTLCLLSDWSDMNDKMNKQQDSFSPTKRAQDWLEVGDGEWGGPMADNNNVDIGQIERLPVK